MKGFAGYTNDINMKDTNDTTLNDINIYTNIYYIYIYIYIYIYVCIYIYIYIYIVYIDKYIYIYIDR